MTEKYGVIIADPPWQYEQNKIRGAAENHYDVLTIDDICALPVQDAAADDAVLLLWATWPLLPEAMRVMGAWGFAYVSGFPWIKIHGAPQQDLWGEQFIRPRYGVGYWVRGCSEPLLIARRGKPALPSNDFMGLLSENYRHSRKPENLYHFAESLPGPYAELFARRPRSGWVCFGNEIDGRDIREVFSGQPMLEGL
jgi:N6-adenosine-specific RNA methylase IME4